VTGSSRSEIVTADSNGAYEISDLPPDDYRLELLDVPGTQAPVNRSIERKEFFETGLLSKDLHLFWNGSLEGRISSPGGGPREVWLAIERVDGNDSGDFAGSTRTGKTGEFIFGYLPPGSYVVRINSNGPGPESPYAPTFYPSSPNREGAHVFHLAEGQHIRNVDFALRRLYERKLQVHIRWPDGRPVDEASVSVGYEHADDYNRGGGFKSDADHGGVAEIPVFTGSHIRVWAQGRVEGPRFPTDYHSSGIELDTDRLPPRLELVVSSKSPPYQ
jgi:hypothetical protein